VATIVGVGRRELASRWRNVGWTTQILLSAAWPPAVPSSRAIAGVLVATAVPAEPRQGFRASPLPNISAGRRSAYTAHAPGGAKDSAAWNDDDAFEDLPPRLPRSRSSSPLGGRAGDNLRKAGNWAERLPSDAAKYVELRGVRAAEQMLYVAAQPTPNPGSLRRTVPWAWATRSLNHPLPYLCRWFGNAKCATWSGGAKQPDERAGANSVRPSLRGQLGSHRCVEFVGRFDGASG
jgi:hypothetical protein